MALKQVVSNYNGAVQANDPTWELILLKERYHYESALGNDLQALNVKAIPAMQYLKNNGMQPTAPVSNPQNRVSARTVCRLMKQPFLGNWDIQIRRSPQ